VFYSDFDPPPRSRSVGGLLGIVAAVLLGIGVTVYGYVTEGDPGQRAGQGAGIGVPEAQALQQGPSGIERPRKSSANKAFQLSSQQVKPVQHRTTRHVSRSQAPSGNPARGVVRRTPAAFSRPAVEKSQPTRPTATSAPAPLASPPASIGKVEQMGPPGIPPAGL